MKENKNKKTCAICGGEDIEIIYNGKIRHGGVGTWTKNDVEMYQCRDCGVIWHDNLFSSINDFYESAEYREAVTGSTDENVFYALYDANIEEKIHITGTKIFRNKIVMDIGCGAGAWLDYVKGAAAKIVAVEPSLEYRKSMNKKWGGGGGYNIYAYTDEAKLNYSGKIDVITSFDVLEHVEDPVKFFKDIYELLAPNGRAIIGTPTSTPVMRELLSGVYDKTILYSAQHIWIFSERSMMCLAESAGFKNSNCSIKFFQRRGLANLLNWLKYRRPLANGEEAPKYNFITELLDEVYRKTLEEKGMADYIVIYLEKS